MVQMAAGLAQMEKRREIGKADMEFVIESGHYAARPEQLAAQENRVGAVHGLGVYGVNQGAVMEIEAERGRSTVDLSDYRMVARSGRKLTPDQMETARKVIEAMEKE